MPFYFQSLFLSLIEMIIYFLAVSLYFFTLAARSCSDRSLLMGPTINFLSFFPTLRCFVFLYFSSLPFLCLVSYSFTTVLFVAITQQNFVFLGDQILNYHDSRFISFIPNMLRLLENRLGGSTQVYPKKFVTHRTKVVGQGSFQIHYMVMQLSI